MSNLKSTLKLQELAICSGHPSFAQPLYVGRPNIGNRQRFLDLIDDMLDRKWLSNEGPYVKEFEKNISEYLGVKHCIAMCNGTIALEIAIRALELKGEVIVPCFCSIAPFFVGRVFSPAAGGPEGPPYFKSAYWWT